MLQNKTIGHLSVAYSLPLRVYGKLYGGPENIHGLDSPLN